MIFDHPWALFLLLPLLVWAAWEWRGPRRLALALKIAALAAVVLALAQPRLKITETKVALGVLADTSASIPQSDLDAESSLAAQLESVRGRNWNRVIPFARATRDVAPDERSKERWSLRQSDGTAARGTNLEAAVRDGAASLPAGLTPRLLLVSDGHENVGTVARAIWQAQQLGIPIDTMALPGRPQPSLRLEAVAIPGQVFSAERFPIEILLESPKAAPARIGITAEGKTIGSSQVDLKPGLNRLRVQASVNSAGAIALEGRISSDALGEVRFDTAVTLRRPRALLVSNDPAPAEQYLKRVLETNQFDVSRASAGVPNDLQDFQLVILNNWNMESIPAGRKAALEAFIKKGGGVLWIAGERNVYVEKKGAEDALERALPAKLLPPRNSEGTAVVLIIDKSSSMEGRKMELARLAAVGVVQNLRPIDQVGVLVFDNSNEWAVPIAPAEDRAGIARLISGIEADGGTQIAPALAEAYRRILPVNAVYKHIVLLTDGISEEGDSTTLAREALKRRITVSTVGLGQDVNRAFLERIATLAQGRSYFLNEPSGLEQILLRDVEEHTGSTAVERAVRPRVLKKAEILDGVGVEQAPPLHGYIRFESRPSSEAILEADHGDPLLVRWQYGLGRAAVFTSDAKNRWAADWVSWPGFDRLWANIMHDLLPHGPPTETTADFDRASNELVVDYRLSASAEEPAKTPDIFVFGPDGYRAPLPVTKLAAGHYRGRLNIGQNQGLFRVRPVADSRAFPEVGFYREEDELREYGANEQLLRQIAAATGGRFNPSPKEAFDAGGLGVQSSMELWPALLGLAILLNLAELLLRKGKGVLEALHLRRRPAEAV